MSWIKLGSVDPHELIAARLQLHWAAQVVSAPGTSLLEPAEDFSHTNLQWLADDGGILAGRCIGPKRRRAGLRFEALELVLIDPEGATRELPLAGRTLEEGLEWLSAELGLTDQPLQPPEHELPKDLVGEGRAFVAEGAAERGELARWFANAASLIPEAAPAGATELVCWPHHFDLATLIVLDPTAAPEEARSVGVGLSPGDDSFDQPYFYVTPWPYPDPQKLPRLEAGGYWHTHGFTAMILTADRVLNGSPDTQRQRAKSALIEAIEGVHAVL